MTTFNWSPGIGDPTFLGWFTVFAYLVTCWFSWDLVRGPRFSGRLERSELQIWTFLALLFLALGINKQLDLQTALTEIGRALAHAQGWYERRFAFQVAFIAIGTVICAAALVMIAVRYRRAHRAVILALVGTALLVLFVVIRASSFHHIDRFIGERVLGWKWNWILEIGGILIVLLACLYRRRTIADVPLTTIGTTGQPV